MKVLVALRGSWVVEDVDICRCWQKYGSAVRALSQSHKYGFVNHGTRGGDVAGGVFFVGRGLH